MNAHNHNTTANIIHAQISMLAVQIVAPGLVALIFCALKANPLNIRSSEPNNVCNYTIPEFEAIFNAIDRGLDFFDRNLEHIILDTAMGTRTIEAQISIVLDRVNYWNASLPKVLQAKLEHLLAKTTEISPKILSVFVRDPDISMVTKMEQWYWVKSADQWMIPSAKDWRPMSEMNQYFNETSVIRDDWNYFRDTFRGTLSDECISQLFVCTIKPINKECKEYFFTHPQSSYTVNHQILYVLMAEKHACHITEAYTKTFADVGGWKQFRKDLCGKVWLLANAVTKKGFTPRYRDMFAEQVAVCSLAGYPNFLRKDWLQQILGWQTAADGCLLRKDADNRLTITTESDDHYVDVEPPSKPNYAHLLREMNPGELKPFFYPWQIIRRKQKRSLRRQKRGERMVETVSGDYCGFHFTSMGMMVFAMHLRYFVETCSDLYRDIPVAATS